MIECSPGRAAARYSLQIGWQACRAPGGVR
jgi:hypothetical protein